MSDKVLQQLLSFVRQKIPLIAYTEMDVIRVNDQECVIKIPLLDKNKNHLDSMYFGVLAVGADCAGGLIAMYQIMTMQLDVALVFKDFSAQFLQRPESDVYFICKEGDKIKTTVLAAEESGERVSCPLHIEAYTLKDEIMTTVACFELTLSLKKVSKAV